MRILLVDNDKAMQKLGSVVYGLHGNEVTTADDGEQALSALRQQRYDLLISDIVMPKLDGVKLAPQAAALQPGLPIVLMSADQDALNRAHTLRDLVHYFLRKPIPLEQLEALQRLAGDAQPRNNKERPGGVLKGLDH